MADDDQNQTDPQPGETAPAGAPLNLPEPTQQQGLPDVNDFGTSPEQVQQEKRERRYDTAPATPSVDDLGNPIDTGPKKQSIEGYFARHDAMPDDRYNAEGQRIDPRGEMPTNQKHLQIIADQQDPNDKVAALQTGAKRYDIGRGLARAAADSGHDYKAAGFLNEALKYVPSAHDTTVDPTDTGVVINSGGKTYNLSSDQFKGFVHGADSHFDFVQKNGLQDALERATRNRSAVGAQGPGSNTPDFDTAGPTREQLGAAAPEARDANVPTPEKPNLPGVKGGPAEGFETQGPTREQLAPSEEEERPGGEGPRTAGAPPTTAAGEPYPGAAQHGWPGHPDPSGPNVSQAQRLKRAEDVIDHYAGAERVQHMESLAEAVRAGNVSPTILTREQKAYRDAHPTTSTGQPITRQQQFDKAAQGGQSQITGYDVAGKWDPNGRYAPTYPGENSSTVSGGEGAKPPEGAPPNWRQQLGRGAPAQTQSRSAAFDLSAGDRDVVDNPAAAGAQQFRAQTPAGAIRDPDNPERIIRNPSDAMRRAGQPGYDGAGVPYRGSGGAIDTQGRLVPAPGDRDRPPQLHANDTVTYMGKQMPLSEANRLSQASADQQDAGSAASQPMPQGYAITPQSGGQPVTNVITGARTHDTSQTSRSKRGSSSKESHESTPIYSPIAGSQSGGGGRRLGGQRGLNVDEEGRTAGERTAQATDERTYYAGLQKKVADGQQLNEKEAQFATYFENKMQNHGRVQQQQQLPNRAVGALKEGVVSTFGNGQKWTLRGGKPVQVQ